MKITNIKITIFLAFIISLSLFSTAYAAIPGNCKQIYNGENCGAGNFIVSDGCATDAQVNTWDGICKAKVPANSYEVSCAYTPMAAGGNPYCSWIGSCPAGQAFNGSQCVPTCGPGQIVYSGACTPIATVIFDTTTNLFRATYDYATWKNISLWLVNGANIYSDPAYNVGIGTSTPASKLTIKDGNLSLYNGVNEKARLSQTGNVGTLSLWNSGGTQSVVINSGDSSYFTGGNVGVGTATPDGASKLDVNGKIRTTSLAITGLPGCFFPQNSLKTAADGTVSCDTVSDSDWWREFGGLDRMYSQNITGNVGIGTAIGAGLNAKLHVQGSGYFNGNVGIGKSPTAQALDVLGNVAVSGNVGAGSATVTGNVGAGSATVTGNVSTNTLRVSSLNCSAANWGVTTDPSGNFQCRSTDDGDWTVSSGNIYRNSGNVGIATPSPSEKLHVNGDTRIDGRSHLMGHVLVNQVGDSAWNFFVNGTTGLWGTVDITASTALTVNGSQAIWEGRDCWFCPYYFSWGYGDSWNYFAKPIGIGTSAPSGMLDVNGNAYLRGNVNIDNYTNCKRLYTDASGNLGCSSDIIYDWRGAWTTVSGNNQVLNGNTGCPSTERGAYLTQVKLGRINSDSEYSDCAVEESGGTWYLRAQTYGDTYAWCKAACIQLK